MSECPPAVVSGQRMFLILQSDMVCKINELIAHLKIPGRFHACWRFFMGKNAELRGNGRMTQNLNLFLMMGIG